MQASEVGRVIGYIRVSTDRQGANGYGVNAQREAIAAECERRGWTLADVEVDIASGRSMNGRPTLARALDRLDAGEADALVVAKLDRVSRSVLDTAGLIERAGRKGWALVALDSDVNMSTPSGEMMANVIATFAQFERRMISERTRAAMAAAPAEVRARYGRYERKSNLRAETVERIKRERADGRTLRAIAEDLNADAIPAERGGRWHPNGIRRVLARS